MLPRISYIRFSSLWQRTMYGEYPRATHRRRMISIDCAVRVFCLRYGKDAGRSYYLSARTIVVCAPATLVTNPSPSPCRFTVSSGHPCESWQTPCRGMTVMTSLSVLKNLKRFLPVLLLCFGLLLLISPTGQAQGLFALPQSFLSAGTPGSGYNYSGRYLGNFSAGYNYHSYNFRSTSGFSELKLGYYLPVRTSIRSSVTPFAVAHLTDLKESPQSFGLANTVLRFGGAWQTRLCRGSYLGVRGEYDATRRQGTCTWAVKPQLRRSIMFAAPTLPV